MTNRIAEYRKRKGFSQKDLADEMNVTESAISLWESDSRKPKLDRAIELAKILGCTIDELFEEE